MTLVGTWNLVESENFEEFLKALGVGFVARKAASSIKPTLIISNQGDKWTIKIVSTIKTNESNFVEGEKFDETAADGRKTTSIVRFEGPNKMIQEARDQSSGQLITTLTREVVNNQLVQTMVIGDVTCKRVFKRKE